MKSVMSHQYENEAAGVQEMKNAQNEQVFHKMMQFKGVRTHTRASAMADEHVITKRNSFVNASQQGPEMWKMKQFGKV